MHTVRSSACGFSQLGSSFSHSSIADVAPTVSLPLTAPKDAYIAGSFVHIRRRIVRSLSLHGWRRNCFSCDSSAVFSDSSSDPYTSSGIVKPFSVWMRAIHFRSVVTTEKVSKETYGHPRPKECSAASTPSEWSTRRPRTAR